MGHKRQWHKAKKIKLVAFGIKLIPTDDDFWRAWKTDKKTMQAAGVRLRKVNGQWQARIEHNG